METTRSQGTVTMNQPTLTNIKLQPCCKRSLEEIRRKIQLGKVLQVTLGSAPLLQVLANDKAMDSIHAVYSTDWNLLAEAVKSVDIIVKSSIQRICADECLYNHTGGQLHEFWKAMYYHFTP